MRCSTTRDERRPMARQKIAYISRGELDTTLVKQQLAGIDYDLTFQVCMSPGETIEAVKGADLVIGSRVPLTREVIQQMDAARAIVTHGHGFDEIDHNAATDEGIVVANCAGFVTEEVSNHTLMMLLGCSRRLNFSQELVRSGGWGRSKAALPGILPTDEAVLGLVGVGNIGRAVARKAKPLGLEIIAHDPYLTPWDAREYGVGLVDSIMEVAEHSDFVSIHTPLNDETRHLISGPFFKAMKPTAYIINVSRGPIIDEKAMIEALQSGEIAGAGIDVFEQEPTPADNPLLKMDNVIVTPHSAGRSDVSGIVGATRVGEEAARVLKGMLPRSVVNPEVRGKANLRLGSRR